MIKKAVLSLTVKKEFPSRQGENEGIREGTCWLVEPVDARGQVDVHGLPFGDEKADPIVGGFELDGRAAQLGGIIAVEEPTSVIPAIAVVAREHVGASVQSHGCVDLRPRGRRALHVHGVPVPAGERDAVACLGQQRRERARGSLAHSPPH